MSTAATATNNASSSSSAATNSTLNSLDNIDTNQFLQMMIAELQNQDPLNPTDTSDIMTQMAQMQQISSTNQLSTTLNGLSLGQQITSASGLIGQTVTGTDANGNAVNGTVSQISIANGQAQLQIGSSTVPLANVTAIAPNTSLLQSLLGGSGSSGSGSTGSGSTGSGTPSPTGTTGSTT